MFDFIQILVKQSIVFSACMLLFYGCQRKPDNVQATADVRTIERSVASRGLRLRLAEFEVALDSSWRVQAQGNNDRIGLRFHITNTSPVAHTFSPGILAINFNGSEVRLSTDDSVHLIPLEDAHQSDFTYLVPRKLTTNIAWMPTVSTAYLLDSMLAQHVQSFSEFVAYFKRAISENDSTFLASCIPVIVPRSTKTEGLEEYTVPANLPAPRSRLLHWIRPHGQAWNISMDSAAKTLDISSDERSVMLYFRRKGTSFYLAGAKYFLPFGE